MSKTRPNPRPRAGRRFGMLGLAALFVGGAAACQPQPQPHIEVLTDEPGQVQVTVTDGGAPVDAQLFSSSGTSYRSDRTGSDGTVTLTVATGDWSIEASAPGAPLEDDPLCHRTLVSDPAARAHVTSHHTTHVEIELTAGPIACT